MTGLSVAGGRAGCRSGAGAGVDDLPGGVDGDGGLAGAGGTARWPRGRDCWRPLVHRSRWRGGRTGSRAARIRELASAAAAASTEAGAVAGARVWVIERTASRRAVETTPGRAWPAPRLAAGSGGELGGRAAWMAWQPWMRAGWVAVSRPTLLGDLVRGRRAQDRAAGGARAGDRGLVLADDGFHRGPPVR